jgi:autotransporter-associated beta strand protein
MKPSRLPLLLRRSLMLAATITLGTSPIMAATWYWDTDAATSGAQQGIGTWTNGGVTWWDENSTLGWNNAANPGNTAHFGSSTGEGPAEGSRTVTIDGTVNAAGLAFNTRTSGYGYILSGGVVDLGAGGYIEATGVAATELTRRHQILSSISGSNIAIRRRTMAGNSGLAMLQLHGSNTWTGTLSLSSSESSGLFVEAYSGSALNTLSSISVGSSSSLILSTADAITANLTLTGTGSASRGSFRFDVDGGSATGNITLSGNTSIGTLNNTITGTLSGIISQAGATALSLTINGGGGNTGTVVVSGANTYTGKTIINNGVMSVATINSVVGGTPSSNMGAPTTVDNGIINLGGSGNTGQLLYTGTGETTDRIINLAGTTGGGSINSSGTGLLKFTSDLTATGSGAKAFTLQGTGEGEIAGIIVNSDSATRLIKSGTGTWTLSGANTYTGSTTISEGTLRLTGTGRISSGALIVNGGLLDLNGISQTVSNLTGTGGSITNGNATASILTVTAGSGTYSGTLTDGAGSLALNKGGIGTFSLSGANSYSGITTIQEGVVVIRNNTALGSTTGGTVVYDTARITLADGVVVDGEALSITGQGGSVGALQATANSTGTWNGPITTYGTEARIGAQAGGHLIINGDIDASARGVLLRTIGNASTSAADFDSTIVTFGGTYTGTDLYFYQGVLKLGASNRISDSTVITFGTSASTNIKQRFDLNGYNDTVAGVKVDGDAASATHEITNSSTTLSTLNLNSTIDRTFSGVVTGNLAIQKSGLNTVGFAGINTYTGDTTVSLGTFNVTGQLNGGGSIHVSAGAIFNLGPMGTFLVKIGDNGVNNSITSGGITNIYGTINFDLTSAVLTDGNFWEVVHSDGSTSWEGARVTSSYGDFSKEEGIWRLNSGDSSWAFDQGTGILTLAYIPEPGTSVLLVAGLAGCVLRRRRI